MDFGHQLGLCLWAKGNCEVGPPTSFKQKDQNINSKIVSFGPKTFSGRSAGADVGGGA